LKFVAKANENRSVRDACMLPEAFWQNGSSVWVHFKLFALAEIDKLKGFAKRRARGLAPDDTFNLFDQTRTASLDRGAVEVRVAMYFISALLGEDGAKRRWDGDASPWIDLAVKARGKFIHLPSLRFRQNAHTDGRAPQLSSQPSATIPVIPIKTQKLKSHQFKLDLHFSATNHAIMLQYEQNIDTLASIPEWIGGRHLARSGLARLKPFILPPNRPLPNGHLWDSMGIDGRQASLASRTSTFE